MAEVKFNDAEFRKLAEAAANAGLDRCAQAAAQHMRDTLSHSAGRFATSSPGSPPNYRRGTLRKSIEGHLIGHLKSAAGATGKAPYARIQETGGTIRPRTGKYLPVPVNEAAMRLSETKAATIENIVGVSGTGFLKLGQGLRQLNLQFIPGRNGKSPLLMGRDAFSFKWKFGSKSSGGTGMLGFKHVPVWVLKRSVRLPPRPWARPSVERNRANILDQFCRRASRVLGQSVRATYG